MKTLINTFFALLYACFLSACSDDKSMTQETNQTQNEPVPIAKSDANLTLPSDCDSANSDKPCFDEANVALPVVGKVK